MLRQEGHEISGEDQHRDAFGELAARTVNKSGLVLATEFGLGVGMLGERCAFNMSTFRSASSTPNNGEKPDRPRWQSCTPSLTSRSAICLLIADFVILSSISAREKPPQSVTARKVRINLRSKSEIWPEKMRAANDMQDSISRN
jgi:hypothetical protein